MERNDFQGNVSVGSDSAKIFPRKSIRSSQKLLHNMTSERGMNIFLLSLVVPSAYFVKFSFDS